MIGKELCFLTGECHVCDGEERELHEAHVSGSKQLWSKALLYRKYYGIEHANNLE